MQHSPQNFYKKILGQLGEDRAIYFLLQKEYLIIKRNFTTPYGEVDIVAQDTQTNDIVFCEVKTRKNMYFGRACEAVHFKKQQKYISIAEYYLQSAIDENINIRFDVIEVYPKYINHIISAFIA